MLTELSEDKCRGYTLIFFFFYVPMHILLQVPQRFFVPHYAILYLQLITANIFSDFHLHSLEYDICWYFQQISNHDQILSVLGKVKPFHNTFS